MILKPRLFRKPPHGHPLGPDGGLVGCWPMNEGTGGKVLDLSGNKNTGTLVADTHWVPGKFGHALDFDGTGDYVDCGIFTLVDTGPFTVITWVNIEGGGANAGIVSNNTNQEYKGPFLIQRESSNTSLTFYSGEQSVQSFTVPTGWIMLASVRYSGTIGIEQYVNAKSVGTAAGRTGVVASQKLYFAFRDRDDHYLDGQIGNVLIYNRALSAAEVRQLKMSPFCMFEDDPIELWTAASGAPVVGLSIPIAMHHYKQMAGVN